jgi:cellulose synthase/poly-beta-1,6-N-acetylglucosamine synthase-like glycosyltransferase
MFLSFSIIAINVFTIRQETDKGLSKSIFNENNIYRFCGYSIIVLMALIPLCSYFQFFKYSTLVLEALSLFFFGTAWIIKGRALGDKGNTGKALYGEVNLRNTEG